VPPLIAQQLFQPAIVDTEEEEALGGEDPSIIHRREPARHDGHSRAGTTAEDDGQRL
jgi:hypothetical protein